MERRPYRRTARPRTAHRLDRESSRPSRVASVARALSRLTEWASGHHVYGATELYGPYTICERQEGWGDLPVEDQARLLGRQGVHYVIAEPVRVVDDRGDEVGRDGETLGEVLMRGNNVMTGYLDDPEQTDETLADGWYHSGDLAVRHPDGYIELRDRKKDIIVSGGENVPTIEVEQAVSEHPAVATVAVVSMPDEKWGERPKAFVELRTERVPPRRTSSTSPRTASRATCGLPPSRSPSYPGPPPARSRRRTCVNGNGQGASARSGRAVTSGRQRD